MIELYCEYLSVRWIWVYAIIMSCTSFRVNPHPIVCLNIKELLARNSGHIWSFKWQQGDLNPQQISSQENTHPFSQTDQMIELCCDYLSVRCIWLHIIIMTRTSFRVDLHSIVCLNVKELLAQSRGHIRSFKWEQRDSNPQPLIS